MIKKNRKGFTLIELLVVIAIIGLLSTLAVVSLNSARGKARDAKRLADIKQIQTALEMYYLDEYTYPSAVTSGSTIESTSGEIYMGLVPTNPSPQDDGTCAVNNYTYTLGSSSTYTLTFCIGSAVQDLTAGSHTATPAGIQ